MSSTLVKRKYKKQNWKYLVPGMRDIRIFKGILEQKFLRRTEVIQYIFDNQLYAETRIRKLKKFGYLKSVRTLATEPESYLLDKPGVEALEDAGYSISLKDPLIPDRNLPLPQEQIEIAFYLHDTKVTQVRFLFEQLGFCTDWKSEKMLKMGAQGERKVPDGFFTRNGKGIAVEVELNPKKPETYQKIIRLYEKNPGIHYIFYVCGDLALMRKVMKLSKGADEKGFCFILCGYLMEQRGEAYFTTQAGGKFKLRALL